MNWFKNLFLGTLGMPEPLLWLQRRETWAGDVKANFIRVAGLTVFSVNELVNYHLLRVVDKRFHVVSLLIIFLWALVTMEFHILLRKHWLPRATPYLMAGADVFLLTWLLFMADGPKSPLVSVYFLIIALSALRLNPSIVLATSAMAGFGYASVWDFAKRQRPEVLVPVSHLVIVLLCLILSGLILAHGLSRIFELFERFSRDERL